MKKGAKRQARMVNALRHREALKQQCRCFVQRADVLAAENQALKVKLEALSEAHDKEWRRALAAGQNVLALTNELCSRVVVVPERSAWRADGGHESWNACLDELARLNGKTVSMADIRACLDAELREWTGDHRKAVEVALTDSAVRISALLGEGDES